MTPKVIIFDFDGTIADTYDAFVGIINGLADEFGYKKVSQEELKLLRNLNSQEIIKQSNISIFKVPALLRRVKRELSKEIENIKPISDIQLALLALRKQGYQLGIVTSNTQNNVEKFLNNHDLASLFDFVYSDSNLFGKHKILKKLIKRQKLVREEIIYVGDETRDIEAAHKSGIKVIAVGWGFNSPEVLAKYNPHALVEYPSELKQVVEDLSNAFETLPLG